jgi:hypothetical protein
MAFHVGGAPYGVRKVRVATVDDDITRLKMRDDRIDKGIDRVTGFHQQEHLAGPLKVGNKFFDAVAADNILALGTGIHKVINLAGGTVEHGYFKTVAFHVQNEVFAHHGEADQADIAFLFCAVHCVSKLVHEEGLYVTLPKVFSDVACNIGFEFS